MILLSRDSTLWGKLNEKINSLHTPNTLNLVILRIHKTQFWPSGRERTLSHNLAPTVIRSHSSYCRVEVYNTGGWTYVSVHVVEGVCVRTFHFNWNTPHVITKNLPKCITGTSKICSLKTCRYLISIVCEDLKDLEVLNSSTLVSRLSPMYE